MWVVYFVITSIFQFLIYFYHNVSTSIQIFPFPSQKQFFNQPFIYGHVGHLLCVTFFPFSLRQIYTSGSTFSFLLFTSQISTHIFTICLHFNIYSLSLPETCFSNTPFPSKIFSYFPLGDCLCPIPDIPWFLPVIEHLHIIINRKKCHFLSIRALLYIFAKKGEEKQYVSLLLQRAKWDIYVKNRNSPIFHPTHIALFPEGISQRVTLILKCIFTQWFPQSNSTI